MADTFLMSFRHLVADLLTEQCTPPTYSFLPDDVAHLPCHVVGRPSARESATAASVMRLSLDVTLLGRRLSDEDAQTELLVYADEAFAVLGGTRGVRVNDQHLACRTVLPGTVMVAGSEYPAYVLTVTIDALTC